MVSRLVMENASTLQDQDEYQSKYRQLSAKYESLVEEIEELEVQKLAKSKRNKDLQDFITGLKQQEGLLTDFDELLWETMIESITITKDSDVEITFKNGAVSTI